MQILLEYFTQNIMTTFLFTIPSLLLLFYYLKYLIERWRENGERNIDHLGYFLSFAILSTIIVFTSILIIVDTREISIEEYQRLKVYPKECISEHFSYPVRRFHLNNKKFKKCINSIENKNIVMKDLGITPIDNKDLIIKDLDFKKEQENIVDEIDIELK